MPDQKLTFDKKHTYLIAELGNIHLHDMDNCKQAVKDTFSAGADLVKLQCINPLTAWWASKEQLERYKTIFPPIDRQRELLKSLLSEYPDKIFASVFDPDYVLELQDIMPIWKVAFRMRSSDPLIARMLWSGKPIFFSTRGKFYMEDHQKWFIKSENFFPLYATEYQSKPNLGPTVLQSFKSGRYAGVSINFGGNEAISLSKYLSQSCQFIELHVQGHGAKGPDSLWSLSMKELERVRSEIGG